MDNMEKTFEDFIEPIVIAEMMPLTWENVKIAALRYGEYMENRGKGIGFEAALDAIQDMPEWMWEDNPYTTDNLPTNPYRKGETE